MIVVKWSSVPVQILMVVAIKTSENLVDRVDKGSIATVVVYGLAVPDFVSVYG